jgi:threonine dehydrogenase-like Zn-dependent dehydrogenase
MSQYVRQHSLGMLRAMTAPLVLQVPPDVTDEEAVLLGDILSTAFFCAENGGVHAGQTVAVVGCGPVGLLTVLAAQHLGAVQVSRGLSCTGDRHKDGEPQLLTM